MKYVFLLCIITINGCALSQDMKVEAKMAKEREQLKRYAMCKCLAYCLPEGDSLLIKDGSTAGYFEIGHYSIDVYPLIDSLARINAAKILPSKKGKRLCFMKCMSFYSSDELGSLVMKLDKEINVDALKE